MDCAGRDNTPAKTFFAAAGEQARKLLPVLRQALDNAVAAASGVAQTAFTSVKVVGREVVVRGHPEVVRGVKAALPGSGGSVVVRHRTSWWPLIGTTVVATWTVVLAARWFNSRQLVVLRHGGRIPQLPPTGNTPWPQAGELGVANGGGEFDEANYARSDANPVGVSRNLLAYLRNRVCFRTRDYSCLLFLCGLATRWQVEHGVPDVAMSNFLPQTVALAFCLSPMERAGLDILNTMSGIDARRVLGAPGRLCTHHTESTLAEAVLGRVALSRYFWSKVERPPVVLST